MVAFAGRKTPSRCCCRCPLADAYDYRVSGGACACSRPFRVVPLGKRGVIGKSSGAGTGGAAGEAARRRRCCRRCRWPKQCAASSIASAYTLMPRGAVRRAWR